MIFCCFFFRVENDTVPHSPSQISSQYMRVNKLYCIGLLCSLFSICIFMCYEVLSCHSCYVIMLCSSLYLQLILTDRVFTGAIRCFCFSLYHPCFYFQGVLSILTHELPHWEKLKVVSFFFMSITLAFTFISILFHSEFVMNF